MRNGRAAYKKRRRSCKFARIANLKPFTLDFPSNTIKNDLLLTTKGELKMEMKKMMKRAGLGLMLAAAMAGLAGCGGNSNKESASKPAAGAKVAAVAGKAVTAKIAAGV